MKRLLIICLMHFTAVTAQELHMLYNESYNEPQSPYEKKLVDHVKTCWKMAINLESKLDDPSFLALCSQGETPFTKEASVSNQKVLEHPYYHLLNNLCAIDGVSHLHIGLLKGGSFIAALYENQSLLSSHIGIDWFKEYSEEAFYSNCDQFLGPNGYKIINGSCFCVDKSTLSSPVDIYFYDADHSLMAHEMAFTYYNDVFADVFVAIVDDWWSPWVRKPTFKAFDDLGYHVLYEAIIPDRKKYEGQYVAVIRK